MARTREIVGETLLEKIFDVRQGNLRSKAPTVLSCGGIYIPHRGRRRQTLYHILNTPCRQEPVKVVSGARPKNVLYEVLLKESMN